MIKYALLALLGVFVTGAAHAEVCTRTDYCGSRYVYAAPLANQLGPPTIAGGTGSGSGYTISIPGGHDTLFTISDLTAGSPAASSTIGTVTFGNPWPRAPICVVIPINGAAWAVQAVAASAVTVSATSTTTATLTSGSTQLGTTTYTWAVHCGP